MKRFKDILLVDGRPDTEVALERAAALAEENDGILLVMDVLETLDQDIQLALKHPLSLKEIVTKERSSILDNLLEPLRQRGVRANKKVVFGVPFVEIIREVLRNRWNIVMTVGGRKEGFKEMFFGTTTMQLMRKCPSPVWVVNSAHRGEFSKILAAVDPSTREENINKLNRNILELAISLAEREQSELHVVHCWEQPLEVILRANREISRSKLSEFILETRDSRRSRLQACLDEHKLDKVQHHIHLLKGEPGKLIPEFARDKDIDVIVMGTVCRTGVAGFFMGNTAEKILNQVACSVLTVKPDGFVTPVELE
jgi:nucleotide-binding universal stress UspA family protein